MAAGQRRGDQARRHARAHRPAGKVSAARRRRVVASMVAVALVLAGAFVATTAAYQARHHVHTRTAAARSGSPNASPAPPPSSASTAGATDPALWQLAPAPAVAALTPLVALPNGAVPKTAGVTRRIAPPLADPALAGATVSLVVADPLTGAVLADSRGSDAVLPASTAKLAVAVAALEVLGPGRRFTTKVMLDDDGRAVLVGGGDPTLAGAAAVGPADPGYPEPARLTDLARQAASALTARGIDMVQLGYDASLFAAPATAPGWKPAYVTEGDVAPVRALEVDEGRPNPTKPARTPDPAALAATDFAVALSAAGIKVAGPPTAVATSAAAAAIASVSSPTVGALVQRMLGDSDNDLAEALARQVALATGKPATFTGGAAAVRDAVVHLGVSADGLAMVDGSGLSTSDRMQPRALVQLLGIVLQPGHPELASIRQGLPVAGFSGTLANRYTTPPAAAAAGVVHAKTGTLDGVVALAGYEQDADGRVLTFAVVAASPMFVLGGVAKGEAAVDRLVAALGACGCS